MQKMLDEIYQQIEAQYEIALEVQQTWQSRLAMKEKTRADRGVAKSEVTHYNFVVAPSSKAFRCYWQHVKFVRQGTRFIRIEKQIPVPESGQCKLTQFKHAQEWELEFIKNMEKVLVNVRINVKYAMKIHRLLLTNAKLVGKDLNVRKDSKYWLRKQESSIKKFKEKL